MASVRAMMTKCDIGTRIHGGLDAVDHFLGGHEFFAGAVAAALGADLVFNMHGGCAGT